EASLGIRFGFSQMIRRITPVDDLRAADRLAVLIDHHALHRAAVRPLLDGQVELGQRSFSRVEPELFPHRKVIHLTYVKSQILPEREMVELIVSPGIGYHI